MEVIIPITTSGSAIYSDIPNGYALGVSLAANIRKLRRAAELTQDQLGDALGVGQAAVSRWERGKTKPDADALPAIARMVSAPLDALLEGVDSKYDASRDLPLHPRTTGSGSHQKEKGEPDAQTTARMEQDRKIRHKKFGEEIRAASLRLFAIATALVEDREAVFTETRRRGGAGKSRG